MARKHVFTVLGAALLLGAAAFAQRGGHGGGGIGVERGLEAGPARE